MLDCTLLYNQGTLGTYAHVRQIFTGFFELQRHGTIKLGLVRDDWNSKRSSSRIWNTERSTSYLLRAIVNDKHKIIYDMSDGIHLDFIREVVAPNCDILFKRSYTPSLAAALGPTTTVLPLGLNYEVTSRHNEMDKIFFSAKTRLKFYLKSSKLIAELFKVDYNGSFYLENFEYLPITHPSPKILFLSRLYDPKTTVKRDLQTAIEQLDEVRINCILRCKKEFKARFFGGVYDDRFARTRCPGLVVPRHLTTKASFLKQVKESEICIATTGLNDSIGWKFAEYVAASRAIVSEPLLYGLPGGFRKGLNYLEFTSPDQLVTAIYDLLDNEDRREAMMQNNNAYYNSHVQPEHLVLNSLKSIDHLTAERYDSYAHVSA